MPSDGWLKFKLKWDNDIFKPQCFQNCDVKFQNILTVKITVTHRALGTGFTLESPSSSKSDISE